MEEKEQKSFIYIEFESPTSVSFANSDIRNVTSFQLFAIGKYLVMKGEQLQMSMEMQQARMAQEEAQRKKISIPTPNMDFKNLKPS
jgi:hypothetical protein